MHIYEEQHSALSTSPLSGELQRLLGPVTYTSGKQEGLAFQPLLAETPYQEGKAPIREDAWHTDGSSCGQPPKWRAVAFHPNAETIWMEDGGGKISQWVELQAVWLVITEEPSPIAVCTDRWAVYWGLTLWLLTWYHANWFVGHWPLWGQELWQDLWASG